MSGAGSGWKGATGWPFSATVMVASAETVGARDTAISTRGPLLQPPTAPSAASTNAVATAIAARARPTRSRLGRFCGRGYPRCAIGARPLLAILRQSHSDLVVATMRPIALAG